MPTQPAFCTLTANVQLNGMALEKATVRARLTTNPSTVDGIFLSTAWASAKTDIAGAATLKLIQQGEFTTGDGTYTIEAFYNGKKMWSVTAQMPNESTANLEDLI